MKNMTVGLLILLLFITVFISSHVYGKAYYYFNRLDSVSGCTTNLSEFKVLPEDCVAVCREAVHDGEIVTYYYSPKASAQVKYQSGKAMVLKTQSSNALITLAWIVPAFFFLLAARLYVGSGNQSSLRRLYSEKLYGSIIKRTKLGNMQVEHMLRSRTAVVMAMVGLVIAIGAIASGIAFEAVSYSNEYYEQIYSTNNNNLLK